MTRIRREPFPADCLTEAHGFARLRTTVMESLSNRRAGSGLDEHLGRLHRRFVPLNDDVRLADLLAALSLISDLGLGLPPENAMRSCLVGTALARAIDLGEKEVADVFYTSLLQHIGCTGYAHETYLVWIDDIAANRAARRTNFADPKDLFKSYLPTLTQGMSARQRARIAANFVTKGPGFLKRFTTATCEVAAQSARRLGLSVGVQRGLHEVFEWWNGKGSPQGLKGDDIALVGRVAYVGSTAAEHDVLGGPELAIEAVRRRAGTIFDPAIADAFVTQAAELLETASLGDPRQRVLEAEPEPVHFISEARLPDAAAVFGDIADLKAPFMHGHSAGVATIARVAGEKLGLDPTALLRLHVAALLHDLGRIGVPDAVWEKPGELTTADWEQIRLHPYHSERILSCSPVLQPIGLIAGMHHERVDGSGYHRGCKAPEISVPARVLAAADALQAMTQSRPHREALNVDDAADQIRHQARDGRLDPDAVEAVVDAAGGALQRKAAFRPAGLSDREVEVLRLMAEGHSNREVARRLYISPRTAEHHVQHIYTKIGVSSRAAAAVFAMEHGLIS
jgi:HD-GYP domain-containing protein (c-di-GMP phosphodiesterase class II)